MERTTARARWRSPRATNADKSAGLTESPDQGKPMLAARKPDRRWLARVRRGCAGFSFLAAAALCLPLTANEMDPQQAGRLNRQLLDQSLARGTEFLLSSQLPDGSFRYHVNFQTGATAPEQNAVRQAGALWGLALVHQARPADTTRQAVLRGVAFFQEHSELTEQQARYIQFPGTHEGESGAVALVSLALVDFLRAEPAGQHEELRTQLSQYLRFLMLLQRHDHRFYRAYRLGSGEGFGLPSPYFDGEILLALTKAARYAGRPDLQPQCLQAAAAMYEAYARQAVADHRDSDETKGFFQWGSLAFLELYEAGWEGTEPFATRAIALGHWMIDTHRVLMRQRNTAYALEGILCGYELARKVEDQAAAAKFRDVIERGLYKLTTWQVGGPVASAYLKSVTHWDRSCRGGVLGADQFPWLRIDTTQHQMHAVILARRYIWNIEE